MAPLNISPVLLALTLITTAWLLSLLIRGLRSPIRTLPGPLWSHFTHLPLKLAVLAGRRSFFIHSLHQHYGPVVRISPWEVAINDADATRQIHGISGGFVKSPWYDTMNNMPVPGVFTARNPKMHSARRILAGAFSKTEMRGRWEGMMREKVGVALAKMEAECGDVGGWGGQADLLKWWTFLATDISGTVMFGESFDMLELGKKNDYIHVLECAIFGAGIGCELPWVAKLARLIPLSAVQIFFNADAKLCEYGEKAVRNGKKLASANGNQGASIFAQLDPYEQRNSPYPMSDLDIRVEASGFILAASDTTAVTLTYLTWAILRDDSIRRDLENELFEQLPSDGSFTDKDIEERCPFLNACIWEALRLYTALPSSLPRTVPKGGVDIAGYFIPEGLTVSTQAWSLHRDKRYWPDAEEFNPRRFFQEPMSNKSFVPASPTYQPFGGGPRICLGWHMALVELRLATAEFFRTFSGRQERQRIHLGTETDMDMVNHFLVRPKGEACWVSTG